MPSVIILRVVVPKVLEAAKDFPSLRDPAENYFDFWGQCYKTFLPVI